MNTATRKLSLSIDTVNLTDKEIALFWAKVDKNGPLPDQLNQHYAGLDPCWIWTGGCMTNGYGNAYGNKKPITAHRFSAILHGLEIPHGFQVNHRCDRKNCCNPNHLSIGTHTENMEEMKHRGRAATGERHGSKLHPECLKRGDDHPARMRPEYLARGEKNNKAKLTDKLVIEIRAIFKSGNVTHEELAAEYGVSRPAIGYIVRRQTWKHVA
jgi:HNH endonuclease